MCLSLYPCFCFLPFPSCLSPSAGLRDCQAKVTSLYGGWLTAQTHIHRVPPRCSAVPRARSGDGAPPGTCPGWREGERKGLQPWRVGAMWAGRGAPSRGAGCWGGSRLCLRSPRTQPTRLSFLAPTPALCSLHRELPPSARNCAGGPADPAHCLPAQGLAWGPKSGTGQCPQEAESFSSPVSSERATA